MTPKFSTTLKRILAAFIDLLLTGVFMAFIMRTVVLGLNEENIETKLPFSAYIMYIGMLLCALQFYFRDWLYCGRSLGKRLFKLIIVSTNERGRPSDVSGGKKLLRQLFCWFIMPIEFFVLLFSGKTLGDMVAETLVIPEKDFDDYCAAFEEIRSHNQFYVNQPNYGNAPFQNGQYGNGQFQQGQNGNTQFQNAQNGVPDYFKNTPADRSNTSMGASAGGYSYGNYYQQNVPSAPKIKRDIDPALLSDNYSPLYDLPIEETPEQPVQPEQTDAVNSAPSEAENTVESENPAPQAQGFENPTQQTEENRDQSADIPAEQGGGQYGANQTPPQNQTQWNIYSSNGNPPQNSGQYRGAYPYTPAPQGYGYYGTSVSQRNPNTGKIVAIAITCCVLFVAIVVGIVVGAMSAVKNSEGYNKSYSYIANSTTFKNLGATREDIIFVGYEASKSLSSNNVHKKSVEEYTFSVKGATLTVVCHTENEVTNICTECTKIR